MCPGRPSRGGDFTKRGKIGEFGERYALQGPLEGVVSPNDLEQRPPARKTAPGIASQAEKVHPTRLPARKQRPATPAKPPRVAARGGDSAHPGSDGGGCGDGGDDDGESADSSCLAKRS